MMKGYDAKHFSLKYIFEITEGQERQFSRLTNSMSKVIESEILVEGAFILQQLVPMSQKLLERAEPI